ncbi:putative phage abortive infection protein [Draconibacterium aestuarii]|uniref:putative phage abortive infection protein n=1 Tax=Draconibacterium aestuarii TaxID=2998507 RepID=UPI0031BBADB8
MSAIIVIILWASNFILLAFDGNRRGVFGDMFGVVNSLFSGLAFAGIIITIFLQSRELKLQRDELAETREEFKTQNLTLRLQRFENTFFNMLSLHHDIVNNIDCQIEEARIIGKNIPFSEPTRVIEMIDYKGRDVFELHYSALRKQLANDETIIDISNSYGIEYKKHRNDFDHYFSNLYQILTLVDSTQFTENTESIEEFEEKCKFISLLGAQLSAYELLWLFYNSLYMATNKKFKRLIEKYSLFNNLGFDELADLSHVTFYEDSAYVRNESEKSES